MVCVVCFIQLRLPCSSVADRRKEPKEHGVCRVLYSTWLDFFVPGKICKASAEPQPFVSGHNFQPTPKFRCKRLVASFEVEQERLQQRLERSIKEEPAKLLSSCDDVTRLCRVRASGLESPCPLILENYSFIIRLPTLPRREYSEDMAAPF